MSWDDFHRRRRAVDAVLDHARRDPTGPLPFDRVSEAPELFAGPEDLLLALHHRWTLRLAGRVEVALADPIESGDPVTAVATAWLSTAAEFPVLRAVLDTHTGRLAAGAASEHRLLALSAGLADPAEHPDEIARIGAAFLALVRTTPHRPARHRTPVRHLLDLLSPSA